MFFKTFFKKTDESDSILAAMSKSQAIIEFNLDGTIVNANENFLNAVGYTLEEIKGKHHKIFVDPAYAESSEYKKFWENLRTGKFDAGQYKRVGKGGKEIWIEASYNPVFDKNNLPYKVVKFATDITSQKLSTANYEGQLDAISKAQAVIEFNLDGTISTANKNFLDTLGYELWEIEGKHHRMFVEPGYAESGEYKKFWEELRSGHFHSGEYKRLGKGGKEVWIQASYNPILDMNGKPFKVVKYASDVTDQVNKRQEFEHIVRFVNDSLERMGEELEHSTQSAASASTQTSATVQTVASAAEELASSIKEISRSMNISQSSVNDAINQSADADKATASLAAAAQAMTSIVDLIQDIAAQINLLSLNATIESARAGEAGKGFAVVANEVKNLASQAKEATDKISTEITHMQSVSKQVVSALHEIRGSIDSIMGSVSTVASAIEEQASVTNNISSNMQMAAQSTEDIDQNIHTIVDVSSRSKRTANEIKEKLVLLAS